MTDKIVILKDIPTNREEEWLVLADNCSILCNEHCSTIVLLEQDYLALDEELRLVFDKYLSKIVEL